SITRSFSNRPGLSNVPRFDGQCGATPATIVWVLPAHLPLMFGIASAASSELAIEKVSAAAQMKMSSAQSLRVIALSGWWGGSISPAAGWYRQRHDIMSVITSTDWCPASVIRLTSYQLVGMVRL